MLAHVTTISDFMSKDVITAYSHSNVSKAIGLMVDHNVGGVIVVDDSGSNRGLLGERFDRQSPGTPKETRRANTHGGDDAFIQQCASRRISC